MTSYWAVLSNPRQFAAGPVLTEFAPGRILGFTSVPLNPLSCLTRQEPFGYNAISPRWVPGFGFVAGRSPCRSLAVVAKLDCCPPASSAHRTAAWPKLSSSSELPQAKFLSNRRKLTWLFQNNSLGWHVTDIERLHSRIMTPPGERSGDSGMECAPRSYCACPSRQGLIGEKLHGFKREEYLTIGSISQGAWCILRHWQF